MQLRAFFDGPYGSVPNFSDFEKVVLLAGGSGASFTFAIAMDLISQPTLGKTKAIEFVWAIKDQCRPIFLSTKSCYYWHVTAYTAWFESELQQLSISNLVNVTIHITNQSVPVFEEIQPESLKSGLEEPKEIEDATQIHISSTNLPSSLIKTDVEATDSESTFTSLNLQYGRPDLRVIISHAVSSVSSVGSVCIAACGPQNMMGDTRNAVARLTRTGGPSLTLHTEQFKFA